MAAVALWNGLRTAISSSMIVHSSLSGSKYIYFLSFEHSELDDKYSLIVCMKLVARVAVLLHVGYKLLCACMCVMARAAIMLSGYS